ncbi:MAG: hypothetical protein PHO27_12525 [Sulfuricurvum sp.]|nr:hypothetical protein [Sulfuricurvum sp.]
MPLFNIHPSNEMVELFRKKPYQGQTPQNSKIIFLSSDANYTEQLSNSHFFNYILEYQNDGINFWKKYNCHHPFLLDKYPFNKTMDGVPFHRNFSKLGLTSNYAESISFVELLNIPTIGNKSENRKRFYELVDIDHLKYIEELILNNKGTLFFISNGVLKEMQKFQKKYGVFKYLNLTSNPKEPLLQKLNDNMIVEIYHFSSSNIHDQISEIRVKVDNWLMN